MFFGQDLRPSRGPEGRSRLDIVTTTTILVISVSTVGAAAQPVDRELGRIVVPLDGSEYSRHALGPAVELARRTGARLELMTTKVPEGPVSPRSFLDEIADGIGGVEISTTTTEEREPGAAIESLVEDGDHPVVIVMSSHGRGRLVRAVMGSVAERIVGSGIAPVVVVGPEYDAAGFNPDGPVLVAHDGDHEPDVDAIARLARAGSGRVVVLEIIEPPVLSPPEGPTIAAASAPVEATAARLRELGLDVVAESRQSHHPGETIVERAAREQASYLAVTTRARSGAPRIVLGSVASDLVRASAVPLLISPATAD